MDAYADHVWETVCDTAPESIARQKAIEERISRAFCIPDSGKDQALDSG
jgi:hypothetical protein